MDNFLKYQEDSEARFAKHGDERWEKEQEMEDKRRKEEREHEMRMMAMISNMFRPPWTTTNATICRAMAGL